MGKSEYEQARKRVKAKKEFYQHLTSYIVMGIFFFLLNAVTSFGAWWFYWPMLGWGIGVIFHYFDVFGFPGVGDMSNDWEEKEIEAEIERMRSQKPADQDAEPMELRELQKERRADAQRWNESDLV